MTRPTHDLSKAAVAARHGEVLELLASGLSKSAVARKVGMTQFAITCVQRKDERKRKRIRPGPGPDDPLDSHDLSTRTRNCIRYGIAAPGDPEPTLRDVTRFTAAQLLRLPYFGKRSLAELEGYMARIGLALVKTPPAVPKPPREELVQYEIKDAAGRTLRYGVARMVRLGPDRMRLVELPEAIGQCKPPVEGPL